MSIIKYNNIESYIINIRNKNVILDKDVAIIYGVETKRINEAVKNNLIKFPKDYYFQLNNDEFTELKKTFNFSKNRFLPKVFTEKGLYMLATILKSEKAIDATFAIIETFSKVKELSNVVNTLSTTTEKSKQKKLMERGGEIISEILDSDLETSESETTIELNFAVLKFKHTVKKNK